MKRKWLSIICFILIMCGSLIKLDIVALAEITIITLETDENEVNNGDEVAISVYLNSDVNIGAYYIEIKYDMYRLEYIGGGDSKGVGKVILEGTGYGHDIVYKLKFKAISGGMSEITCVNSDIRVGKDANNKHQDIKLSGDLLLSIKGEDTAVSKENKEKYDVDSSVPLCGVVDIEGEGRYYIVDHSKYVPDVATWNYTKVEEKYGNKTYTFLTNPSYEIRMLYLMDEDGDFHMYAYSKETQSLYPCKTRYIEEQKSYIMSTAICTSWPEELTLDYVKQNNVIYAMKFDGECGFYKYVDGEFYKWNEEDGKAFMDGQMKIFYYILIGTAVVILVIVAGVLISHYNSDDAKKRRFSKNTEDTDANEDLDIELIEVDNNKEVEEVKDEAKIESAEILESEANSEVKVEVKTEEQAEIKVDIKADSQVEEEIAAKPKKRPVISVKNVTMKFRISTSDASGIKEYFLQKIKKQVTYREFLALDNVSFDVYKGEIVGIIGTNGSGKSTLLRVISGALGPTEGRVRVNRRKLQLLTLGTGFDMELTARENIYLNAAIIGYTEQFINENFDKIIEFAELQDFVDEKVKNFSSGMVSRLGFAIATIGEASEILILDEVLSVGDEFFRKKSLKRVKEMIHSGSTVLMVSHGMSTIIENCTKVVWIEKGKLKMVGEPEVVCAEYRKLYESENAEKPQEDWYTKNGELDKTYTGLARNKNGWWYVKEGKVDKTYTGLAHNENGWWYVKCGKLDTMYTGLVHNENGWWYVKCGKLDTTYTGLAHNENGWWYVKCGKLDTTYTGLAHNENGWWYMKNGKLDGTYTGLVHNENGWWYVKCGKLDNSYIGIVNIEDEYWYVNRGKVDKTYIGIVNIENEYWYVKEGKVDFTYCGDTIYNQNMYKVKNGKVV